MSIFDLFKISTQYGASDLHIVVGAPPMLRINGKLEKISKNPLTPKDTVQLMAEMANEDQMEEFEQRGEIDFSYSHPSFGRFRVNAYKQQGNCTLAIRIIPCEIPTIDGLGLPKILKQLSCKQRGLILVTGPAGSGKSTTLAAMIDYINCKRNCHILTLEDPIEYLHQHKNSIVTQREIRNDSKNFTSALRAALRQDPDVILIGEMRDLETIRIAITAAETGHLVLSTLHTLGAEKTIDRVMNSFPFHEQQQIRIQISNVLEAVISQQLLICSNQKNRVAAFEIMIATPAIRNLIREGKTHQIQTAIQTGSKFGMQTMDDAIFQLYRENQIDKKTALTYAIDREYLEKCIAK